MPTSFIEYKGAVAVVPELPFSFAVAIIWSEGIMHSNLSFDRSTCDNQLIKWREEVENSGVGCLELNLKPILNDARSEKDFLQLIEQAEAKLHSFDEMIPESYLNSLVFTSVNKNGIPKDVVLKTLSEIKKIVSLAFEP